MDFSWESHKVMYFGGSLVTPKNLVRFFFFSLFADGMDRLIKYDKVKPGAIKVAQGVSVLMTRQLPS